MSVFLHNMIWIWVVLATARMIGIAQYLLWRERILIVLSVKMLIPLSGFCGTPPPHLDFTQICIPLPYTDICLIFKVVYQLFLHHVRLRATLSQTMTMTMTIYNLPYVDVMYKFKYQSTAI